MLRTVSLLLAGMASQALANAQAPMDLTLTLSGLEGDAPIYVALYDTEDSFLEVEEAVYTLVLPVNDRGRYVIPDVLPGDYALILYQDTIRNEKLDRKFYGPPKEPFGMSNNPKVRFGPPSYDDCLVTVDADTRLSIRLK